MTIEFRSIHVLRLSPVTTRRTVIMDLPGSANQSLSGSVNRYNKPSLCVMLVSSCKHNFDWMIMISTQYVCAFLRCFWDDAIKTKLLSFSPGGEQGGVRGG